VHNPNELRQRVGRRIPPPNSDLYTLLDRTAPQRTSTVARPGTHADGVAGNEVFVDDVSGRRIGKVSNKRRGKKFLKIRHFLFDVEQQKSFFFNSGFALFSSKSQKNISSSCKCCSCVCFCQTIILRRFLVFWKKNVKRYFRVVFKKMRQMIFERPFWKFDRCYSRKVNVLVFFLNQNCYPGHFPEMKRPQFNFLTKMKILSIFWIIGNPKISFFSWIIWIELEPQVIDQPGVKKVLKNKKKFLSRKEI
jgi:hypothetical protein